jgi:hypothetical protein
MCYETAAYICTEKETYGKRGLLSDCCKRETETANFHLFAANGNGKREIVYLGQANEKWCR